MKIMKPCELQLNNILELGTNRKLFCYTTFTADVMNCKFAACVLL